MTTVEICLEDLSGVMAATGADRIELCANLAVGGITPSIGTVDRAIELAAGCGLDVQVLIRQRPGDFVFTGDEIAAMVADIRAVVALGEPAGQRVGVVVGALDGHGRVDRAALARFRAAAAGRPVTFHRAFDAVADQLTAWEVLAEHGVDRVLTSGGAATAATGAGRLAELVRLGGPTVLAAGGIRPGNAAGLIEQTGVGEIHLRAPGPTGTSAAVVRALLAEIGRGT